jgi:hypothetical protein
VAYTVLLGATDSPLSDLAGPCFGITAIGVGLGIWLLVALRQSSERAAADAERARTEQARRAWDRAFGDLALTCHKCRKLALPIPNTGNRYRCEHCQNQFAGARHGLDGRP